MVLGFGTMPLSWDFRFFWALTHDLWYLYQVQLLIPFGSALKRCNWLSQNTSFILPIFLSWKVWHCSY